MKQYTRSETHPFRTGNAPVSNASLPPRARVASAVALALVAVTLGACSSDDDDGAGSDVPPTMTPGGGGGSTPGEASAGFAVVTNDGTNPGSVTFYTPDLAATTPTVLMTGANQGIAFGSDGTMYQNGDSADFTGIRAFPDAANRTDAFDATTDSVIGSAEGKGLTLIPRTGESSLLASCDVSDAAAGTAAEGQTPAVPGTELKLFDAEDTDGAAAEPETTLDLSAACWDTFYAVESDTLYVAQVDGTLAIFDEFSIEIGEAEEGEDATAVDRDGAADRTVTPVDENGAPLSINFHGIYAEGDSLLVSDVGDAAIADDGQLFVFTESATLDGDVTATSVIGGPATMLGNPVDAVLKDGSAIIAEKSNDMILVFDNVATVSGDMVPDNSVSFSKPESVEELPAGSTTPGDATTTDEMSTPEGTTTPEETSTTETTGDTTGESADGSEDDTSEASGEAEGDAAAEPAGEMSEESGDAEGEATDESAGETSEESAGDAEGEATDESAGETSEESAGDTEGESTEEPAGETSEVSADDAAGDGSIVEVASDNPIAESTGDDAGDPNNDTI